MKYSNKTLDVRFLSFLFVLLSLVVLTATGRGAQANAAKQLRPGVVTNYVLVTNIVIVTNYVVTTNLVLTTNAVAASPKQKAPLPDLSWVPPEDGFDWIQLKSGEWLKGHIKAMQKHELEFDSEELELLKFDWKDIRQVRSPRVNDLLFKDQSKASGPIAITPDLITIGGDQPGTRLRSELQSITPSGKKERNYWSGKIAGGMTLQAGNTRQVDYNAQAHLERRSPGTRLAIDYVGNFSSIENVETVNNQRANAEFDYWLTSRLYLITPFFEYFRDPLQNVDRRLTGGAGLGYDLIYAPKVEWTVHAGPAYQHSWFSSVEDGEPGDSGAAALAFGSHFEWKISRRIDLTLDYRGQYTSKEAGLTTHHSAATLEFEMTKRFDLDISLFWDRTQNPAADSNGDMPKPDDLRMVVGLGVRF